MKRLVASLTLLAAVGGVAVAEEGHPLRLETVDFVIEQNDRAVQGCNKVARRDMHAVVMQLEIDPSGKVVAADPEGGKTAEAQCLARVARKLHFPSTGVTSRVAYPFLLLPQIRR